MYLCIYVSMYLSIYLLSIYVLLCSTCVINANLKSCELEDLYYYLYMYILIYVYKGLNKSGTLVSLDS